MWIERTWSGAVDVARGDERTSGPPGNGVTNPGPALFTIAMFWTIAAALAGTDAGSSVRVAPAAKRAKPSPVRVSASRVGDDRHEPPAVAAGAVVSVK